MKSISSMERDDYVIISNPNSILDYKINTSNYTIGSGERGLYFGELQVYNTLRVEGELNVLQGNTYTYNLSSSITVDTNLYGTVNVTDTVNMGAELTIL